MEKNDTDKGRSEPQILPHEAEARKSAEAEPPHPAMDSPEDGKYHQVRFTTTVIIPEGLLWVVDLSSEGEAVHQDWI